MSKNNLLILAPYLSLSGGVASFVNSLKGAWGVNEIYYYRGGKGKGLSKYIQTLSELFKFLLGLLYYKNPKVFINTSLNKKAYMRDRIFCGLAKVCQKDVYLFVHGWDVDFFESIKNKFRNTSFFKVQKIFVLSKSFKTSLITTGYPDKNIIVEHTVVAEEFIKEFNNSYKVFDDIAINLLFLARLEESKGVFTVLESFKKLIDEHPNLILNIAGTGTETTSIKKWLEMNDNLPINFHGRVEGANKLSLFKNAHFYLLPTTHSEGLPISILEAISSGCIVFVTPSGGLKDFFKHKEMGFLLSNPSQNELINKINIALENNALLSEISFNNIKKGQTLYAPSNLVNRIKSSIYE